MIALVQTGFDARAEADCLRVPGFESADALFFGLAVQAGRAVCLAVELNGERCGSVIASMDRTEGASALVVNVCAVEGAGDSIPPLLDELTKLAKAAELPRLRFWTRNRALVRRARAFGFTAETVMEKEL